MEEKNTSDYLDKARAMLHDTKLDDGTYSDRLGVYKNQLRAIVRAFSYRGSLSQKEMRDIDNMWKQYENTLAKNVEFERMGLREPTIQVLEQAREIADQENYADLKGMLTYAKNRVGQGKYLCSSHIIQAHTAVERLRMNGKPNEDLEKKVTSLMEQLRISGK